MTSPIFEGAFGTQRAVATLGVDWCRLCVARLRDADRSATPHQVGGFKNGLLLDASDNLSNPTWDGTILCPPCNPPF